MNCFGAENPYDIANQDASRSAKKKARIRNERRNTLWAMAQASNYYHRCKGAPSLLERALLL